MNMKPLGAAPALALLLALAACASAFEAPLAHATSMAGNWPPPWQDDAQRSHIDFTPPSFAVPAASHCHRAPTSREVPGGEREPQGASWRSRMGAKADAASASAPAALAKRAEPAEREDAPRESKRAAAGARDEMRSPMSVAPALPSGESAASIWPQPQPQPLPWLQPLPQRQRPVNETVTAGVVDDNADFGAYLSYRQRQAGLPVRDRDISERYLLEVTDVQGRPVHDAEVAVQRPGLTEPVMWARTDTAGKVWLHPRAFMAGTPNPGSVLGVAVRKGGAQARATLLRGQAQSVQVRLGDATAAQRPRLDLVFLVDATGSMGDEIAKLKTSMRAMSQQISQLPGQPDICYGLVAYRDRGDVFLTRTHDFTDDLGAFQQMLARVQAAGGGDTPEALNEALHEVVHHMSWRADAARLVVLVADAPPHLDYGGPQYDRDMQAALAKGIKLFAVGASGLDPVGEYIFRQMAQYTAGRFVFLTYKNAADPGSGPGTQTVHDVKGYSVQTLDQLVVRLVAEEMARLSRS